MSQQETLFYVSKINWERIYLNITLETEYEGIVEFKLEKIGKIFRDEEKNIIGANIKKTIPLKHYKTGKNVFMLKCNLAALDGRNFLDNGRWRLMAVTDECDYVCYASNEIAYHYDDYSRIFRYGGGKYAYNISLSSLTENEEYLWFLINSYFVKRNDKWKKRHYIEEANTKKGRKKRIKMVIAINLMKAFYQVLEHLFPKKGKNILLMSETKDYLWGNLLYIDKRLKERGLDSKFKISYSFRKAVGNHMSAISWAKTIFLIAKQDYVFVDDYVPIFGFLNLNKRTKLIQVWHAGVGFKSVGYSRFGKVGTPFPVGSCHKKYDYALISSKKLTEVYAEVFGIEDEAFLPVGMPRLDGFLDKDKISGFRKKFFGVHPTLEGKKIILFAPTFRGKGQKTAYYDYNWLDLKEIYEFCGNEYIFLIKMHPFVSSPIEIPEEYCDRIMDFAAYPNINDLYYITDILITDYSSNYFEFSLMKRPIIFYTPDREIYELSRGVHRSVKENAPGKVCDTFEEMMTALKNKDYEIEKVYKFVEENFDEYDGHAADKAIDYILLNKR